MITIAIRARLAATSTGAKYKRIDGHTAFPRMASRVPPCEPLRSRRHCRGYGVGQRQWKACANLARAHWQVATLREPFVTAQTHHLYGRLNICVRTVPKFGISVDFQGSVCYVPVLSANPGLIEKGVPPR